MLLTKSILSNRDGSFLFPDRKTRQCDMDGVVSVGLKRLCEIS
ncbi:hypothetical protein BDBG_16429 [Blastomyces gilchristii SLH14081]|uniref:Uncharacterized protein n=1 Tax=Blastomyces gilchristii (strain SLH14081) TaxID=559298 RepID=A0A179UBG4_BLAGS|nr:uncharacterized protein BDBG_16429 [Blastomyces gilchristii SLH14081]OAT05180.1 hypothetical protein BDBG_16429 [Blastomyces gilchristii SLH14081]